MRAGIRKTGAGQATSISDVARTLLRIGPELDRLWAAIPDTFDIPETLRTTLHELIRVSVLRGNPSKLHSGLVVAGYGEKDVFPGLSEVIVDGAIGGRLRTRGRQDVTVAEHGPQVIPYAQTDMTKVFLDGVSPMNKNYLERFLHTAFSSLATQVALRLGIPMDVELEQDLVNVANRHATRFIRNLFGFLSAYNRAPIITMLSALPKEELAGLAESLVGLTAMKQRVSDEMQTVGLPVDVALISKGDGFIWLRRKHYFELGRNPGYLARRTK